MNCMYITTDNTIYVMESCERCRSIMNKLKKNDWVKKIEEHENYQEIYLTIKLKEFKKLL